MVGVLGGVGLGREVTEPRADNGARPSESLPLYKLPSLPNNNVVFPSNLTPNVFQQNENENLLGCAQIFW